MSLSQYYFPPPFFPPILFLKGQVLQDTNCNLKWKSRAYIAYGVGVLLTFFGGKKVFFFSKFEKKTIIASLCDILLIHISKFEALLIEKYKKQ